MKKFLSSALVLKAAVVTAVLVASTSASAVLPLWATEIITDAGTAGDDSAAAVGPVIGAVMVSLIVIKLVKRFANKI